MLSTPQIISHQVRHKPTKWISDKQHCYNIWYCLLQLYGTICDPWFHENQSHRQYVIIYIYIYVCVCVYIFLYISALSLILSTI